MTEQLELLCILTLRGVLFGVITSGSAIEREEFVSMVLTTFRLFASGQNLADTLYFRYTEQRPEWLTRKGKVRFEWSMAQKRMISSASLPAIPISRENLSSLNHRLASVCLPWHFQMS